MRGTSLSARRSISAGTLRERVMETITLFPEGLTCDEVEDLMGGRHQTISPRINELWSDGKLDDSGHRRLTRSGRQAIVWVVAKKEDAKAA
jgi:hypothetical protein